ncbi:MAG: hypothetical protein EXR75_00515 [Myxococcales bacterium]|nr:hypothetical protein [Myxococcales bacterium]
MATTALAVLACSLSDTMPVGAGGAGPGGSGGAVASGGSGGQPIVKLESVAFAQAIDGAMFASRSVYAEVPIHLAVTGIAEKVTLVSGGTEFAASDADGDGTWTAALPIAALPDGALELLVKADGDGINVQSSAALVVGEAGIRFTDFDKVGYGGSPLLHRDGDKLYVTWHDRSLPLAEVYLQRLDGAFRPVEDRVKLVGSDVETLHSRIAIHGGVLGILYQQLGVPYKNYFKVTDLAGKELVAPIALDPAGTNGAPGGAVAFDGTGFVFSWRSRDGGLPSHIHWGRVVLETGKFTGPITVATAGAGDAVDPIGPFQSFTSLSIAPLADRSAVSFVRDLYLPLLETTIPKAQLAIIGTDGELLSEEYAGTKTDFLFHWDSRVYPHGDTFLSVYPAVDLNSDLIPPWTVFHGKTADAAGLTAGTKGAGVKMVNAVDDRGFGFYLPHPKHHAVMGWLDHRTYVDISTGRIELYVAPVGADLVASNSATVFEHAKLSTLSQLTGVLAGTNVPMVWRDARINGYDKLELWFDTAWY